MVFLIRNIPDKTNSSDNNGRNWMYIIWPNYQCIMGFLHNCHLVKGLCCHLVKWVLSGNILPWTWLVWTCQWEQFIVELFSCHPVIIWSFCLAFVSLAIFYQNKAFILYRHEMVSYSLFSTFCIFMTFLTFLVFVNSVKNTD